MDYNTLKSFLNEKMTFFKHFMRFFGLVFSFLQDSSKKTYFKPLIDIRMKGEVFTQLEAFTQLDYLLFSIAFGIHFLLLQGYEYATVGFHINDSAFGSIFFLLTGLHGLHVIVGILFLSFNYLRIRFHAMSWRQLSLHFGAWYWHFVDVVWILLYLTVYLLPYLSAYELSVEISGYDKFFQEINTDPSTESAMGINPESGNENP